MLGVFVQCGLLLFAALLHAPALGSPPEPCGPLKVGVRDFPRLYERDAKGEIRGLDKDFFDALAQRSGCTIVFQPDSQPRIWQGLRSGQLDMTNWVIQTVERAPIVNVIPLLHVRPMAMTWRDSPVQTQADFMADATLIAVKIRQAAYGTGYDELFEHLREQGRLSEVADFDAALRVFSARRVSLMVTYPWSVLDQSERWMSQVRFSDWHPGASTVQSGLAISRRVSIADAKRLEDAVIAMQRDGSLAQIVSRHLPADLAALVAPPR
ncbi:MAG: transporter substrate-binding domain-containing protein [Paucibacter sp.]|nr:transporter substrate-binding domain-containing protein [Roseateles sp.]